MTLPATTATAAASSRRTSGAVLRDGGEGTDTNKDGVITVDELAARMASRMSEGGGFRGPPASAAGPPAVGSG